VTRWYRAAIAVLDQPMMPITVRRRVSSLRAAARRSVSDVLNTIGMSGLNWSRIDQPLFDRIVDTILGRMFGERGFAPEGQGGDEGIDYTVDDNTIIFQYKFFPDGANTSSRRRQIVKTLRAKAPNAALRSPVGITFSAVVPADSTERHQLEERERDRVP
jgi:hypothetical protein